MTAALALASSRGWISGAVVELLLVVGTLVVVVCAGWLVTLAVVAGLLRAGLLVFAPVQPWGLERIVRIMELYALEREAAAGPERKDGP